jgi:hypothetical protein
LNLSLIKHDKKEKCYSITLKIDLKGDNKINPPTKYS